MTDDELIARAIRAGWAWLEDAAEWPGSAKYPYTGWKHGPHTAANVKKADYANYLRNPNSSEKHLGFDHNHDCLYCSLPIWLCWDRRCEQAMVKNMECFHCKCWMDLYRDARPRLVVDMHLGRGHYQIGEEGVRNRGFGGAKFVIEFADMKTVVSHNLWSQGIVPDHFHERFKVNARFKGESDEEKIWERTLADSNSDDTTILAYADWLEEHGQDNFAAAVREKILVPF